MIFRFNYEIVGILIDYLNYVLMHRSEINELLLDYCYYVELCYINIKYYNLSWFKVKQNNIMIAITK